MFRWLSVKDCLFLVAFGLSRDIDCSLHALLQGIPLGVATRVLSSTPKKESYTARQLKTGRPISPHVEIYDFPPAAISSITNRITGVALVGGEFGLRRTASRSYRISRL